MGTVIRLVLVMLLVLGGWLPNAAAASSPRPAAVHCHDRAMPSVTAAVADPCRGAADLPGHCVVPAGICCTIVLPMAADLTATIRPTVAAWGATGEDLRSGRAAPPVTPPPRT
ncbi:hypothetical protein EYW49_17270 [Siculibacillus lacustris]|uniref:DUF3551 domain-containing protein n=1 Tax=Siculibacillus lacustris TaxID=1549641 RepID=A0A4Q9VI25_9HYPH|nr:hypothetical protein [Siculibacillus lacustris]TBW34850.1 hypothetical protein EYW49_17270 [Siculibacillus lacustris]